METTIERDRKFLIIGHSSVWSYNKYDWPTNNMVLKLRSEVCIVITNYTGKVYIIKNK